MKKIFVMGLMALAMSACGGKSQVADTTVVKTDSVRVIDSTDVKGNAVRFDSTKKVDTTKR